MRNQSYNNFWQRIHQSARDKRFPLRVMFELTYHCNFYCKHCYVPQSYRDYNELKTKEVFSILDQLKDIGCFYLGFTGGEPFIREDILDILWYAKRSGFEIIIYTNGSLIDKEIAKQLSLLKPNKVDITIPGMTRLAFERISGVSGSRDKVFKAINLLHKKEVDLGFKSCVLKENENEIKDIQDFAASLDVMHRLDDILFPRLDGSKEPYEYRGQTEENREQNRLSVLGYRLSEETEHRTPNTEHRTPNTDNLFKCGVGVSQAAITPFGELKMCLMIDYPKYKILPASRFTLHASRFTPHAASFGSQAIPKTEAGLDRNEESTQRTNLKDAWERLKELAASIKPDKDYKCNRCELEAYCKWCPAKAWLYNRTFISCEPESRTLAEVRS